jgi:hypothetical protein
MAKLLIDLTGWAGALLLLGAYGAVSFHKLRPATLLYQALNAVGSIFLVINTMYYHAYPSAFVNVIWIGIALVAGFRVRSQASYAVGTER